MLSFWKHNGFEILFVISLVTFLTVLVINLVTKQKGTYTNYTPYIWSLLNKPRNFSQPPPKSSRSFESKGETECRRVAEEFTSKPFGKRRPDFLKNAVTGGHNLELDCYNDELKIGIEYNGIQHYKYVPYFHRNKEVFYNIKYRDDIKKRLCLENGVHLIIVPHTVKLENIASYLRERLAIAIK